MNIKMKIIHLLHSCSTMHTTTHTTSQSSSLPPQSLLPNNPAPFHHNSRLPPMQQKPVRKALSFRSVTTSAHKPNAEYVLAIDVGTSGTKAALVSSLGLVVASAVAPHLAPAASVRGGPNSVEQDQNSWWFATKQAIRDCISKDQGIDSSHIQALAITGQMQDIILLPQDGFCAEQGAILYSDARAIVEATEIAEMAGGDAFLASVTGAPQGATSLLAKFRWLDKYASEAYHQCRNVLLGGHDYVTWKLSQTCVTDATTASTTGLTDCTFQYAEHLLKKVSLDHWLEKLPSIVPSDVPCGEVSKVAAEELGCVDLQGLPVLHCCGDNGACSLGAGAGLPGSMYAYVGTSGWVAGSFQRTLLNADKSTIPGVFTLAHPDSSLVLKTGSIMTAGGNLAWAASNLFLASDIGDLSMEVVDRIASIARTGSGGLLYLPFLNGERCPFEDSHARAAFIGISSSTSHSDMFHSVMEGVSFSLRSARDAMATHQSHGLSPLRLVGGGARSPIWPSIVSNVFGQTVDVLEDAQDVGVKGAALLAGKWLGWHSTLSPKGSWLKVKKTFEPNHSDMELYDELFSVYNEAYNGLKSTFKNLSHHSKI